MTDAPIGQAIIEAQTHMLRNIGPKLAAALVKLQGMLPEQLERDRTVEVETKGQKDNYSYSYATLANITRTIRPLLAKCGLAYSAFPTTTAAADGKPMLVLRYHLVHESGETLTGEFPISGEGMQARGGAITYARRYCLLAVTGLAADEDDDAAAEQAEREAKGGTAQRNQRTTRASRPRQERDEASPEGDDPDVIGDPNAPISGGQRQKIMAQFRDVGAPRDRDARVRAVGDLVGRQVGSTNDLTAGEAHDLINVLNQAIDTVPADDRWRALGAWIRGGRRGPVEALPQAAPPVEPDAEPAQPTGGE